VEGSFFRVAKREDRADRFVPAIVFWARQTDGRHPHRQGPCAKLASNRLI